MGSGVPLSLQRLNLPIHYSQCEVVETQNGTPEFWQVGAVDFVTYQKTSYDTNRIALLYFSDVRSDYSLSNLSSDASYDALFKYAFKFNLLSDKVEDSLSFGVDCLLRLYADVCAGSRVLGYDECKARANRVSSCAIPWRAIFPCRGAMFDDPVADDWLRGLFDIFADAEYPRTIFTGFSKDELRENEKVRQKKTRNVVSSEIILVLAACSLFWEQNERIHSMCYNRPVSVGTSILYRGWHNTITNLKIMIDHIVNSRDYKEWDARCHARLFDLVKRVRLAWLRADAKQTKLANAIYEEIVNAYIVGPRGEVYVKRNSQVSGSPLTADDNSLIHCIVVYASIYYHLTEHNIVPTFDQISKWYDFRVYGDDELTVFKPKEFFECYGNVEPYGTPALDNFITKLGMKLKPETLDVVSHDKIHYLSGYFAPVQWEGETVMCYLPMHKKYPDSITKHSNLNPLDQLGSIASHMMLYAADPAAYLHIQSLGRILLSTYSKLYSDDPSYQAYQTLIQKPWKEMLTIHTTCPVNKSIKYWE